MNSATLQKRSGAGTPVVATNENVLLINQLLEQTAPLQPTGKGSSALERRKESLYNHKLLTIKSEQSKYEDNMSQDWFNCIEQDDEDDEYDEHEDECVSLSAADFVKLQQQEKVDFRDQKSSKKKIKDNQGSTRAFREKEARKAREEQENRLAKLQNILQLIKQKHVYSLNRIKNEHFDDLMNTGHNTTTQSENMNMNFTKSLKNSQMNALSQDSQPLYTDAQVDELLEKFIETEDTKNQIEWKKQLLQAFSKPAKTRNKDDLQCLQQFHGTYKFFVDMLKLHGKHPVMETMRHIKIQCIDKGKVVFDQGECGDKFYIILKGVCCVDIAFDTPVENFKPKASGMARVKTYLQMLYDNFDSVFWARVPYGLAVRQYLKRVKADKEYLKTKIQQEINMKIGEQFLKLFQLLKKQKVRLPRLWKNPTLSSDKVDDHLINLLISSPKPEDEKKLQLKKKKMLRSTTQSPGQLEKFMLSSKHDVNSQEKEKRPSYLDNPMIVKRARSKLIQDNNVRIPQQLANRLERISYVLNFGTVYLVKEVAKMQKGTPFGDLALTNKADTRLASIRMGEETFLAYLDRVNYDQVMKKVVKQNTQMKLQILRQNRYFDRMTIKQLSRLELSIKPIKMHLNQVIYKEGDDVKGMYLVLKGSVKYKKAVDIQTPIESVSKNIYFKGSVAKLGINRKQINQDIAIFDVGELVGFEELIRTQILQLNKEEFFKENGFDNKLDLQHIANDKKQRDFTLICNSHETELLFFDQNILDEFRLITFHTYSFLKSYFEQRASILQQSITKMQNNEFDHNKLNDQPNEAPVQIKNEESKHQGSDIQTTIKSTFNSQESQISHQLKTNSKLQTPSFNQEVIQENLTFNTRNTTSSKFNKTCNSQFQDANGRATTLRSRESLRGQMLSSPNTPQQHDSFHFTQNPMTPQQNDSDMWRAKSRSPSLKQDNLQQVYIKFGMLPKVIKGSLSIEEQPLSPSPPARLRSQINQGNRKPRTMMDSKRTSVGEESSMMNQYPNEEFSPSIMYRRQPLAQTKLGFNSKIKREALNGSVQSRNQPLRHSVEVKTQSSDIYEKESNQFYLKDIKTFLNLRKTSKIQETRKKQTNVEMADYDQQLRVSWTHARAKREILYQGMPPDDDHFKTIDTQLEQRLQGVNQSIQTEAFYKLKNEHQGIRETEKEFKARLKRQMQVNIDKIDQISKEMVDQDEHKKKLKVLEKKYEMEYIAETLRMNKLKKQPFRNKNYIFNDISGMWSQSSPVNHGTSKIHRGSLIHKPIDKKQPESMNKSHASYNNQSDMRKSVRQTATISQNSISLSQYLEKKKSEAEEQERQQALENKFIVLNYDECAEEDVTQNSLKITKMAALDGLIEHNNKKPINIERLKSNESHFSKKNERQQSRQQQFSTPKKSTQYEHGNSQSNLRVQSAGFDPNVIDMNDINNLNKNLKKIQNKEQSSTLINSYLSPLQSSRQNVNKPLNMDLNIHKSQQGVYLQNILRNNNQFKGQQNRGKNSSFLKFNQRKVKSILQSHEFDLIYTQQNQDRYVDGLRSSFEQSPQQSGGLIRNTKNIIGNTEFYRPTKATTGSATMNISPAKLTVKDTMTLKIVNFGKYDETENGNKQFQQDVNPLRLKMPQYGNIGKK